MLDMEAFCCSLVAKEVVDGDHCLAQKMRIPKIWTPISIADVMSAKELACVFFSQRSFAENFSTDFGSQNILNHEC